MARITGTLREDQYTFLIISRSVPLGMRMFQTKLVDKIKIHILYSIHCIENLAVYEIMWKNFVELDWPWMTIWRMLIAC
jgi:hypothetical protein